MESPGCLRSFVVNRLVTSDCYTGLKGSRYLPSERFAVDALPLSPHLEPGRTVQLPLHLHILKDTGGTQSLLLPPSVRLDSPLFSTIRSAVLPSSPCGKGGAAACTRREASLVYASPCAHAVDEEGFPPTTLSGGHGRVFASRNFRACARLILLRTWDNWREWAATTSSSPVFGRGGVERLDGTGV